MAEIARLDVILGGDTSQFTSAMKVANDSLVNFAKTSQAAAQLQPFSNATAGALKAAGSIEQLKDVLAQLKIEQATVFNPAELQAYNNAIAVTTTEIKALTSTESGAQSLGKALGSSFSSVRQLAYILPGIGMAGLFNLAFEAISKAADALDIFGTKTKGISKDYEDLGKSEGESIAKLRLLSSIASDTAQSTIVRKDAVKELQALFPQYKDDLTQEAFLTGKAKDAIDKIIISLRQKAYYEAASAKISTLAAQSLDLDQKKGQLLQQQLDIAIALNNEQKKSATTADQKEQKGLNIFALKGQYDDLNIALRDNAVAQNDVDNQTDYFINQAGRFSSALTVDKVAIDKVKKSVDELTPALRSIGDPFAKFGNVIEVPADQLGATITKALNKNGAITVRPKIILNPDIVNAQKLSDDLTAALQNIAVRGAEAFGESIGNLLAGEKNPFNNLTKVIGQGIKELGALMIKYGVLAEIADKALELGPVGGALAIAAGIGLEALGAYIEAKGGVKTHAEGGIFTQPTMWGNHLIGEAGPEALVPLNRMGELGTGIGGGKQVIEVVGRISGNDLILIQNRAQVANNRAYGNNFNRRN